MNNAPYTAAFAWPAPAKLNLFLHVTGRRADGYHTLQSVFQFLDKSDRLFFVPRGDGILHRIEGPADIPQEQDIVLRAARALQSASGCNLGADIRLEKHLPVGAGLGGGSSDAATTLVALCQLWNLGFTTDELARIGLQLGADVPVFVRGHAAWAEGVGEQLQPMDLPEPWYLVITPTVHVSTAEIFAAPELRRDTPPITPAEFLAGAGRNDCEPVTCARYPQVKQALDWLRQFGPARDVQDARVLRAHGEGMDARGRAMHGAIAGCAGAADVQDAQVLRAHGRARAAMSGTGASVFLSFESADQAAAVQEQAPAEWRTFIARGLNRSPLAGIMRAA